MHIIQKSMLGSQPVRQKVKYKSVSFVLVKVVTVLHFYSAHHVGLTSIHVLLLVHECLASSQSFHNPVLTMFSPSFMCSLTTLVLDHTSSVCFSLLLCKLFLTSCSPCIFLLSSLSLEIALSMYACEFL